MAYSRDEVKLALRTILTLRGLEEYGSDPAYNFERDTWRVQLVGARVIDIKGEEILDQISRDRHNGAHPETHRWGGGES